MLCEAADDRNVAQRRSGPSHAHKRRGWHASNERPIMAKHRIIEAHSIDYIPIAERRGRVWHLWPVWFTGDAQLATLATGIIGIALGLSLLWSAIAIVLGCALGTFFMAFHSAQGPQLGLPQMIQSRPQFGAMGALLVWLVALVTYIGYNAFNQLLAGQSIHQLTGAAPRLGMVLFTLAALAIAALGYDWIHRAQKLLAFMMIAALLAFSLGSAFLLHVPSPAPSAIGFKATAFLTQFFGAAAYQLSWSIYVSDYSRYLPSNVGVRASFWWTFAGAMIGGAWMMLAGMLVAALNPRLDIAAAVQAGGDAIVPGLGAVLLGLSLCGLVTITSLNLYGASLTLLSVSDSFVPLRPTVLKRLLCTVMAAGLGTTLALFSSGSFVTQLGDLLSVLLYLFTPWTAINLVDYYVVRKGHYSVREIFNPHGMYGRWNWRGLTAYAVGFVAMVPFFSTGIYTGPVARALGGADIAMVVGLPVSAMVYLLACRSMDLAEDRRLADLADVGIDKGVA
jgi:purine-cytosine permease-like protein